MDKRERIEYLIETLNAASEAYYGGGDATLTDYEWDAMFDELAALEKETGIILPGSPVQNVSTAESRSGGVKEEHEYPALSLAKTKKVADLQKWAGELPVWLSWKLDGLTLVLTYDEGKLTRILTRGNGSVGNNITYMKTAIAGFPLGTDYTGHLVVRGEATISYPDFEEINASAESEDEKYANPRNLASGTLALDERNIDIVRRRRLHFNAFTLVHTDENIVSWGARMDRLRQLGFTTVDYEKTDAEHLPEAVERWTEKVEKGGMLIPVDGLVISYDDTEYAAGGSVTGHHATRAGLAFKWQDESAVSTLNHIEWSCAASTITPVAVFDPVHLEGTTVSRASLCNISELDRLGLGENGKTRLKIIKANKIIPKCVAVVEKEGNYSLPECCPVCYAPVEVFTSAGGTRSLKCTNPDCAAKNLMKYARFVSKGGMNIDGLSVETLRDFIAAGFIHDYADIFRLSRYSDRIREMEGYGDKSCDNLLNAIEKSSRVKPEALINALCIPLIGIDAAKKLIRSCGWAGFLDRMRDGTGFEDVDGIGPEKSNSILQWYGEEANSSVLSSLLELLSVENTAPVQDKSSGSCAGLTFVITGDVHSFKNRDEFKAFVEAQGGKVTGSVTSKTSYLVNNDAASQSSKNRKAAELGIKIITEDKFINMFKNTGGAAVSRILTYFPWLEEEDIERLKAAAAGSEISFFTDGSMTQEDVDSADIILGNVPQKFLHEQPFKLVQLTSAGADAYVKEGLLSRDTPLCCCTGAYSQSVAEHAFAVTLMLMKNLHVYRDRQNRHQWLPQGTTSTLSGATVVVVGLGDIGRYYARLVKAMGAHVIGIKRRAGNKPDCVDELYTTNEFDSVVSRGDIVMSVMPSTPETVHFFTEERFGLMKDSAIFINCGRGTALDLDVIYRVLSEKKIAAAGLDVFETEPLPESSPLWELENLMITPHSSGFFFLPATRVNVIDVVVRNLSAFLKGEELINVVDFATGYKK